MTIKAIPVMYKGVEMRSRLEARAAAAFDSLGIRWLYEPEGFDLDSEWYLPDFWLPEHDTFLEVKGLMDPASERKCTALVKAGAKLLVLGPFQHPSEWARVFGRGGKDGRGPCSADVDGPGWPLHRWALEPARFCMTGGTETGPVSFVNAPSLQKTHCKIEWSGGDVSRLPTEFLERREEFNRDASYAEFNGKFRFCPNSFARHPKFVHRAPSCVELKELLADLKRRLASSPPKDPKWLRGHERCERSEARAYELLTEWGADMGLL